MALRLVTPPATEPVTVAAATSHLRVIDGAEEQTISDLIAVAREACEEYQNRAYLSQTWELWVDTWTPHIIVPRPPLQAVESIRWYDRENQEHVLDPAAYFVDDRSEPGRIVPNGSWPGGLRPVNGVCVTFVAGYQDLALVPRRCRQAMLLLVAEWYENREASSTTRQMGRETVNKELPFSVTRLLDADRVVPV
jgi:uncharacterized phiE125 gp8 family phage protein